MQQDAQFAAVELGALRTIVASGITVLQENLRLLAEALEIAAADGHATDRAVFAGILERALQALQFDDMAVQLIDRVQARLLQLDQRLRGDNPFPPAVLPLHSAADRGHAVAFGSDAPDSAVELF